MVTGVQPEHECCEHDDRRAVCPECEDGYEGEGHFDHDGVRDRESTDGDRVHSLLTFSEWEEQVLQDDTNVQGTITVSIGRNMGERPMSADLWRRFQRLTVIAVQAFMSELYFAGEGEGIHEGRPEQSFTIVAGGPLHMLPNLRLRLADLARAYRQESIALTVGTTQFVTKDGVL
jgi:hypothetical protein